jgi:hypothetical protein
VGFGAQTWGDGSQTWIRQRGGGEGTAQSGEKQSQKNFDGVQNMSPAMNYWALQILNQAGLHPAFRLGDLLHPQHREPASQYRQRSQV